MFWRLALVTCWWLTSIAKNACSTFRRQFLKLFQFFSRIFVTIYCLPHFFLKLKLTQTLIKLHFCIISSQIFKKRYGFSLFHFIFHVLSLLLLFLWVYWCHYDFVKCHTHSRVCFILVIVHYLRVSVFDFITDVCMLSGVCALFHDSGYSIHIMFMVFYHIICHLNPCNAQWPLDSEVLMFISIIACLFHLSCPCCLWLLVSNLFLVFFFNGGKSPCFTFLYLNLIKLMCVPCGIAFGLLLCD